jgi:hypothetical protein
LDAAGLGRVLAGTLMASWLFSDEELARLRTFPEISRVVHGGPAFSTRRAMRSWFAASPDPLQELLAALGHA